MNTFTFFALLVCAILAMVGAAPERNAPEPIPIAAADSMPVDDMLEGAESRNYGYHNGGNHGHHDHHDHRPVGGGGGGHGGHYGHGNYGHGHRH
ncbi:holotricin-3 isoform X3 [Spodoptera frugiperda]|uniref:Holotricin-3 isoform X3 n=1 Tax=Spodoptera frugiperda TaxID=7108 RepID=A0A9R0CZR7_SPOFR|nr:holotricin-3 isoform X3 [Spodoptera frugiperda]